MRLLRLASLAAIAALSFGVSAQAQELPEGKGKAVVRTACSQCHGLDVVTGQPRSREGWTDVVSQMIGNGAVLSDDDFNLVIDYLATNFGPAGQNTPEKGQPASTVPGKSGN